MNIEQAKNSLHNGLEDMREALAFLNQDANIAELTDVEKEEAIIARGELDTLIRKTENQTLREIAKGAQASEGELQQALSDLHEAVDQINTTVSILNAVTGVLKVAKRIVTLL